MAEFLQVAGGINVLPFTSWAFHSKQNVIRDQDGPSSGWFELSVGRLMVLDLMRLVEGAALGPIEIVDLAAGERKILEPEDGYAMYVLGLGGDDAGLMRGAEGQTLAPGMVLAAGQLPFVFQSGGTNAAALVIQIAQDV
jgi:hypothetical protein